MRKADKAELDSLFASVVKLFQSRCWECHGKYNTKEAFVFHHRDYITGEKKYSDFKLPNGKPDRLGYHRYLIPIVLKNPKRFRLLHHKAHYAAENTARRNPANFKRFITLCKEINRRRYA